jgi:hypothetical protein
MLTLSDGSWQVRDRCTLRRTVGESIEVHLHLTSSKEEQAMHLHLTSSKEEQAQVKQAGASVSHLTSSKEEQAMHLHLTSSKQEQAQVKQAGASVVGESVVIRLHVYTCPSTRCVHTHPQSHTHSHTLSLTHTPAGSHSHTSLYSTLSACVSILVCSCS